MTKCEEKLDSIKAILSDFGGWYYDTENFMGRDMYEQIAEVLGCEVGTTGVKSGGSKDDRTR